MSTSIINLNQALAFQLEGVYDVIKQLQSDLSPATKAVADQEMRQAFASYCRDLGDQRLKLKRIFGYVLSGPYKRKASKLNDIIAPMNEIIDTDMLPRLRDVALSATLQSVIRYVIESFTQARYIAMRLDLNKVVQLIDEILDDEEEFSQKLKRLSATQVNEACRIVA